MFCGGSEGTGERDKMRSDGQLPREQVVPVVGRRGCEEAGQECRQPGARDSGSEVRKGAISVRVWKTPHKVLDVRASL